MAQDLSWTSIALQDLEAIWDRICELGDEREAGLQIEFIHRNIEALTEFPRRFPVFQQYGREDIREFKFATYHAVYQVGKDDSVLVLSLFHTQRDLLSELKRRKNRYL